jgi:rubrerythrin
MNQRAIQLLFTPELPQGHPRLKHLYEKAKSDFWNETTDIDWDRGITLPTEHKKALARLLSITYYGERAALTIASQLVATVNDEEARQVLACQVIEEAKHVGAFQKLIPLLGEIAPPSFFARKLLTDLVKTEDVAEKMVGMHLFVENIANHTLSSLQKSVEDPLINDVLGYIARDEKKHTAIATLYLPELLKDLSAYGATRLKAKQAKWVMLGLGMVWDGYEASRVLGIDLASAGQKALKDHYRLLERMSSTKGLLDIPGFEKIIEQVGKWATPSSP